MSLLWPRTRREPPPRPERGAVLAGTRGLGVSLGGHRILSDVDLTVRTGEILALVGPNGAGKSTLLAALSGDVPAASGEVHVAGRPVAAWSAAELALRRAMLPQQAALAFPFTVAEVVAMGRAPWAGTEASDMDDETIAEVMALCEVAEFAGREFDTLSGGEKARVALARVLAQRTAFVLLDEPTAALDLRHQELVMRVCRARAAAGDAVVVVLHDLGLAAAYCDRVAVLSGGRTAACGAPEEVFTEELLGEVYRQPVEVLRHPGRDELLVLPRRGREIAETNLPKGVHFRAEHALPPGTRIRS